MHNQNMQPFVDAGWKPATILAFAVGTLDGIMGVIDEDPELYKTQFMQAVRNILIPVQRNMEKMLQNL